MRFRRYTIIILLIVSILSACTPKVTSQDVIRSSMEILTSDEFEGRMTGTEGNKKATSYIEEQFKGLGLEAYFDNSYFHEFDFVNYIQEDHRKDLVIEYEDGSKESLKLGRDYVNLTIGDSKGEVVLSLTADINDKDISEKIVLLENSSNLSIAISKAKGMVLKIEDFRKGYSSPSNFYSFAVKAEVYERLIDNGVKNIIYTSNYTKEDSTANNVIGIIKGKTSDNALVLSAHFDHVGKVGGTMFRGAIDNASGTSVLLDLAGRLHKESIKNPFDMDIIFSAFNGEELGLIGSNKFANDLKNKLQYKNIYNINIDCVGSKSGGPIYLDDEDETSKELIQAIKPYLADKSLEYLDGYYGLSDNNSFVVRNIPGITIGQGELEYIHTELDTLDDVDYDYLSRVSDAIFDFIIESDGVDFNPIVNTNSKAKKRDPTEEEWSNTFIRFADLSEEENLQYDEEIEFFSDGHLFMGDGNKPLTDMDEINKHYPGMELMNNLIGYDFKSIDIRMPRTGLQIIYVIGKSSNSDTVEKRKRDLSIDNIASIEIEYEINGEFILVTITNPRIIKGAYPDYLEKITLDQDLKGYSILVQKNINKVVEARGLSKVINGLDVNINFFRKQEGKDYFIRDYYKTEEEIRELIKKIDKENIIEELIEKLGI